MIDRAAIAGLIPHVGSMCLLDSIESWDADTISCRTRSHRADHNPLRQGGRLGALAGIELAAQAMAAHGRLAGAVNERPRAGLIASLRDVICRDSRLDQFDEDLVVTATRLMGDDNHVMYAFAISCASQKLVTGRATVVLQAESPP